MAISDLIEQTIAQHIIAPKVLSYAGTKLNEVKGRFVSANRVYNFVLNKNGVSYSPAGQGDSLLFSGLYLERLDAARKPKVGNDKCNAGKSYQCGKICLGNRRKCHKGVRDVNDARRIASILEGTNEKLKKEIPIQISEKALAKGKRLKDNKVKGRALLETKGKRSANPKPERGKDVGIKKRAATERKVNQLERNPQKNKADLSKGFTPSQSSISRINKEIGLISFFDKSGNIAIPAKAKTYAISFDVNGENLGYKGSLNSKNQNLTVETIQAENGVEAKERQKETQSQTKERNLAHFSNLKSVLGKDAENASVTTYGLSFFTGSNKQESTLKKALDRLTKANIEHTARSTDSNSGWTTQVRIRTTPKNLKRVQDFAGGK